MRGLRFSRWRRALLPTALAAVTLTGGFRGAGAVPAFPSIPGRWVTPMGFHDASNADHVHCLGALPPPGADSLVPRARTVTLRFARDRRAEARPDFGGYRIYRMVRGVGTANAPDSGASMLIRRYSRNAGSEATWSISVLDTSTLEYMCNGAVVNDSILTFVDPDSNGDFQKVCRRQDASGRCISPGDSIIKLVAPPGPHDGFDTWYSITYEKLNTTDTDYEDMVLPDTSDWSKCGTPGVPSSCPNLNHKLLNIVGPVTPTGGPAANLEVVHVVPNPYRGGAPWDQHSGVPEVHFVNLPVHATIKIFTLAGDLVRTLQHDDPVNDFERWDLKSEAHHDVTSGIYIYRVDSRVANTPFTFQNRFIVIR